MRNEGIRVAIAASGLGHVARGMEAWAESLAAALHERGVNITLFRGCGPVKNSYDVVLPCIKRTSRLARIGNVLNRAGAWRVGLGSEAAVESFSYGTRLLWHLRKGYDVVHVQQGSLAVFLDRARKLGLLQCPVVFGNGQKAPPESLARFPYLHFLSPYGMKEVTDCIGERPHWRVIPNFIDTTIFSPGDRAAARRAIGLPQDCFVILSVGMIDKAVKRMDHFIREAAFLSAALLEETHFVIAGSRHPDSQDIERLGKTLLRDKLTILYDLERDRMPDLYRAADIFVLCSPREALGMALIEAMSCGLPAICHTFPTMEWVVGQGGTCVDMKKRGELQAVLATLCNERSLRESAGSAARDRVVAEFSEKSVTSRIIQMYGDVLSDQHERRHLAGLGVNGRTK